MSQGKKWRKGKYKVINWGTYNKDLKKRGDLTIWFHPRRNRKMA
jgi:hypothetical protein